MSVLIGDENVAIQAPTGITDQSGNALNGTYNGGMGVVTDTGEGGSFAFIHTDSDDYISIGDVLTPGAALSGAAWVKTTDRNTSQMITSHYGDSGQRSWYFANITGGTLRVVLSGDGSGLAVIDSDSIVLTNNVWHHVAFVYDGSSVDLYVDGAEVSSSVTSGTIPATLHNSTADTLLGARAQSGSALPIIGRSDDFRIWTTAISAGNVAAISENRDYSATTETTINQPNRVVQRGDDLELSGLYDDASAADAIQVKMFLAADDTTVVDWVDVATTLSGGTWSGSITPPTGGPYYLQVRAVDASDAVIDTTDSSHTILVGEVIGALGQSNMLGRGTPQTYNGTQPVWHVREDGTIVESIDDPSSDNSADLAGVLDVGSMRPLLATLITADQNCPVIFVVNAKGGQPISNWNRPSGSMWTSYTGQLATTEPTSAKAFLWYQGETDAHQSKTEAAYQADESSLFSAFAGELSNSPPVISALLGESNTSSNQDRINKAKLTNWGNGTALSGPVTNWKDLVSDDLHWHTDTDLAQLAALWWISLDDHLYDGPSSRLRISSATHDGSVVTISTSQDLETADTNYTITAWSVDNDDGAARTVSSVIRTGSRTIEVTLSGPLDGTSPTITFGSQETVVGATVPRSIAFGLPATINNLSSMAVRLDPSFDVAVTPKAPSETIPAFCLLQLSAIPG